MWTSHHKNEKMAGCCQNMSNCTGSVYKDAIPSSMDGKKIDGSLIRREKAQGVSHTRTINHSPPSTLSGPNICSSFCIRHSPFQEFYGAEGGMAENERRYGREWEKCKKSEVQIVIKIQEHCELKNLIF